MAASLAHIACQLQRWISSPCRGDASDAVLLERFIHQREEAAFTALVARHGAMVLRLCRRILGDAHEAEDAFQATFLILARKAPSLKQPAALSAWLYGVARRVALKARTKSAGHPSTTQLDEALPDPCPDPLTQLTARELLDILDEEVQRLPAAQQSPFVLCCLEGRTQEEAARILGASPGSVKGRLERGRRRLQMRLARRGFALSAALALIAVSRGAAVSALLRQSAVRAALGGAAGSSAVALADSVLKGMFLNKLASVTALVLTIALSASSIALVYRSPAAEPAEKNTSTEPKTADAGKPEMRVDALGDPLPAGAIARLGTVRFRQGGHITFLRFTPDGKRLVSQGADGVRVWDASNGKELRHIAPEAGGMWGATDLSPDGKRVGMASNAPAGPIRFWDVESGKKAGTLGEKYYGFVSFSPDGKLLAMSSNLAGVELWDVAERKKLRVWKAHQLQVWSMAFSADSRTLLTSGTEGKIRLWDAATGRQLREFTGLDRNPAVISTPPLSALSPDGNLLAIVETNEKPAPGTAEGKARISLRDVATGKLVRQLTRPTREIVPGYASAFSALAFSSDGKRLITGGPDRFLRVWDSATGQQLRQMSLDAGPPASLALSKDGKKLAVVALGGSTIRVLDMTSGETPIPPGGHLMSVNLAVLTPDGRTAVTGGPERSLYVWDVPTARLRRRLEGHNNPILSLQLVSDGRTLYSSGWDKMLRVWDVASGEERRRMPVGRDLGRTGYGGLVVSADGKNVVMVDTNQTIRLLDAASGEERQHFQGPEWILGLSLTPDGRSLVGWSGDLKVRIWDVTTGRQLREYPLPQDLRIGQPVAVGGPDPTFYHAALSPDGRLLAIGSQNHFRVDPPQEQYLIFKDLATGQDVRRLDKLPSDVGVVAFSPDGRVLAWSGFKDPAIRLLEVASGRERRRLAGHRGQVTTLTFSADGQRLISGCSDTTALVWNLGSRFDPRQAPNALTAAQVEALWADLAVEDAARAYQAIRQLAVSSTYSIPFLRKQLHAVAAVDEKRLASLIADLDSDDFAIRQKATTELAKLRDQPLAAYRRALAGKPPLETRRRLEDLLAKAMPAWWDISGERLRSLRAVEALELAGTKEARDVLETLASGAEGTRLTEQAKAALQRLKSPG